MNKRILIRGALLSFKYPLFLLLGEAVREPQSALPKRCDLKANLGKTEGKEGFAKQYSPKNSSNTRNDFQSVSSRPLKYEFSDGLGG